MNKTINIGWNGDTELLPKLSALNDRYRGKNQITKVYGSIQRHAQFAARPEFRLPNMSLGEFGDHVAVAHEFGIEFNYTLNASYVGAKNQIDQIKGALEKTLEELASVGVDRLIISNPMVLEIIHRMGMGNMFALEISTIAHIDTVMQIEALKSMYPMIDVVCGNLLKNRDFRFLKAATDFCSQNGITYEILANEFCSTGFKGGGTHCVFRDSCYDCHCTNKSKEDATSYYNYPMGNCMASRSQEGADWLRSSFVRPQDMEVYANIGGVTQFKVTGRTGTTDYLVLMAEAYLSEVWEGNLLELWKPLETIYREGATEAEHKHRFNIPTERLDGYLNAWVTPVEPIDCTITRCEDCHYCDDIYAMVTGEKIPCDNCEGTGECILSEPQIGVPGSSSEYGECEKCAGTGFLGVQQTAESAQ